VFIAREKYWQQRFEKRGLPVIGDDIKSQVGATITHRVLSRLFVERGVRIDPHLSAELRRQHGLHEHARARAARVEEDLEDLGGHEHHPVRPAREDVHVGPSDYVPWLKDRKWCHIRMEGTTFGDVPLNLELKLEVWDSPNSAGVVIDAVRCAKLGLDHGLKGALMAPSAYFKKSPPVQIPDDQARELTEAFIRDPKAAEKRLRDRAPAVTRDALPGRDRR
jgi:myo-inositol-1-phosphate synthase